MPHHYGSSRVDDLAFTGFLLAASVIMFAVVCATKAGPTTTFSYIWSEVLIAMTAFAFASEIAAIVSRRRKGRP